MNGTNRTNGGRGDLGGRELLALLAAKLAGLAMAGLAVGSMAGCIAAAAGGTDAEHDGSGGAASERHWAWAGSASRQTRPTSGWSGGAADQPPAGWRGGVPSLHNDADCSIPTELSCDGTVDRQVVAARLSPPSHPFLVTEIQYELVGGVGACDTSLEHRIELSSGLGPEPPPTPSQSLEIQATPTTETVRVVTEPLVTPVLLTEGRDLFVGVEMLPGTSCLAACMRAADTDRDYLSSTAYAPHSWQTLSSQLASLHTRIGANGFAL